MDNSLSPKENLQKKLFEKPSLNKSNEFPLIITFEELLNVIKKIPDNDRLKFLCHNKSIFSKILSNVDESIKITIANINSENLSSFFNLYKIIIEERCVINYIYNYDVILVLYNKINEQSNKINKITKFILCIFAERIIDNFEGIEGSVEALNPSDEKKIDDIKKEIDGFIRSQEHLNNEFQLNLDLNDYNLFNIDIIYVRIIRSLIKIRKIYNDYKFTENTFEQLGLEKIEC